MQTVILTIVFLATPAGAQQADSLEMLDMASCEAVAQHWRRWPGGLLHIRSTTCTPRFPAAVAASSARNDRARN